MAIYKVFFRSNNTKNFYRYLSRAYLFVETSIQTKVDKIAQYEYRSFSGPCNYEIRAICATFITIRIFATRCGIDLVY